MANYKAASALREHLLEGHSITLLEAILLFGVQGPNAEIGRLRKEGYLIDSQQVSMAQVVRRINEFAVCQPPAALPIKEIHLKEYWIKQ